MKDVVSFLRDAVRRGAGAMGAQDCYVSDSETLRASNDVLHAGIDWPSGASFALPAEAVDSFLARAAEVSSMKVSDTSVELRCGRLSSTINRRHEEPVPPPVLPDEWLPVPDGFIECIATARKFTNETATGARLWLTAVRLWNQRVTACSGQIMIDIDLPGLHIERPKLLGKPALDFLVTQGKPDEFGVDRSTISFRWDDGRWVRCQTVNAEMNEGIIQKLFDEKLAQDAAVTITPEWREAIADAVALGDNSVGLSISGFKAIKENITTNIDLAVDVPTDHMSWWGTKDLATVIEVATGWNPLSYPDPALFVGNGFKGAIVGVQR